MASCQDFKDLSEDHLTTAEHLINAKDWAGAGYMLGYVLEFSLKAVVCKTLNLQSYPESGGNEKVHSFFKSHNFDQLIMISGLTDLFQSRGTSEDQQAWSEFTTPYLGEWTSMRYSKEWRRDFTEEKVKKLHIALKSLIKTINDKNRW